MFDNVQVFMRVGDWRRGSESNRRIKVLQTSPLPLGYRALCIKLAVPPESVHSRPGRDFEVTAMGKSARIQGQVRWALPNTAN